MNTKSTIELAKLPYTTAHARYGGTKKHVMLNSCDAVFVKNLKMASSTVASATIRAIKGRKILATRAALTLTPNAVKKIKEILENKKEYIGLKVGVRQRGCNGLSYTLEYAQEKSRLDEEVMQDGVRIIIDRKAQLSLLGTEMDYVENKLSSEFVFNNPNIKGTCGCGESFSV